MTRQNRKGSNPVPSRERRFLFLQGPNTPFFARLADAIVARRQVVERINFCTGDAAYWGLRPAVAYRGKAAGFAKFLEQRFGDTAITDLVVFGDRRRIHREALRWASAASIRAFVFEEGYLRPYRVTLESGGVNNHSSLPRDPDWYREVAPLVPPVARPEGFYAPFFLRAGFDVFYHFAGAVDRILYPGYRRHAPEPVLLRYAGYLRRFTHLRMISARDRRCAAEISASGRPYYLLPLQLGSDAQIRDHSSFSGMHEVLEYVVESFARHADSGTSLVIKNHPLDYGLTGYGRLIDAVARRFDLGNRLLYLEDGELASLVAAARGVVTVNSTAGFVALQAGRPTKALADPIYNLQGLTSTSPLEDFWREPQPPDATLYDAFERVVVATTQVNGGFYSREGIDLAVKNSLPVLLGEPSPFRVSLDTLPRMDRSG